MAQNSEMPDKIPGVEFAALTDVQAIQMVLNSVLIANSRGAYKMEETVAMYPAVVKLRNLLKTQAAAQQQQQRSQAAATATTEPENAASQASEKRVTLAPTVKQASDAQPQGRVL